MELGDIDNDGDLDAFVGNDFRTPGAVWLNDGSGTFHDSGQRLGEKTAVRHAELGDLAT